MVAVETEPGEDGRAGRMSDDDFRSAVERPIRGRDRAGHSGQGKVGRRLARGETMAGQIGRDHLKMPREQRRERLPGVR